MTASGPGVPDAGDARRAHLQVKQAGCPSQATEIPRASGRCRVARQAQCEAAGDRPGDAARAVGAASVVVATKRVFAREVTRLREAIVVLPEAPAREALVLDILT